MARPYGMAVRRIGRGSSRRALALALAAALLATALAPAAVRAAGIDSTGFAVPPDSIIPKGPLGDAIRRGHDIAIATRDSLPRNVGNKLRCTSCHLDGAARVTSGSWVGVSATFPQYNARSGKVIRLEDRINECFRRSMNGKPLPEGSRAMTDMVSYMGYLSTGVKQGTKPVWLGLKKLKPVPGDPEVGAKLFAAKCAKCHGPAGQGTAAATPLWGPKSFALGAGMGRRNTLSAFVRWNMPYDDPGKLSDQEAYHLAAFILSHPRPRAPGIERDWPNGDPPEDCPYPTLAASHKHGR